MKKTLTTNVQFKWQVKVPTEGWVTVSSPKVAYLISQKVRKDPDLRSRYGSVREILA